MVRPQLQKHFVSNWDQMYVINGSDEGRFLDTVSNNAELRFNCITIFSAKHKVIIIDEADNTTPDVQLCLRDLQRSLLETADSSLPATTKTKLFNLHSRCSVIDFALKGKEKQLLKLLSVSEILDTEVLNMITRSW